MVTVKTLVRGKSGVFALCDDDTNGRLYYRKDGARDWSRYNGPPSDSSRDSIALGKRGVFCVTSEALWFRPWRGDWRKMKSPR